MLPSSSSRPRKPSHSSSAARPLSIKERNELLRRSSARTSWRRLLVRALLFSICLAFTLAVWRRWNGRHEGDGPPEIVDGADDDDDEKVYSPIMFNPRPGGKGSVEKRPEDERYLAYLPHSG